MVLSKKKKSKWWLSIKQEMVSMDQRRYMYKIPWWTPKRDTKTEESMTSIPRVVDKIPWLLHMGAIVKIVLYGQESMTSASISKNSKNSTLKILWSIV